VSAAPDGPVITGVGMITPLGLDREATLVRHDVGGTAIGPIERFDASDFPWSAAAEVRDFVPRKRLPDRKAVKLMSPPARLAVAAALDARTHAGDVDPPDARDGGLFVAAGYETIDLDSVLRMMAACRPEEADADAADAIDVVRLWREARYRMNPLNALKILPNMALAHVSIALGLQGANSSIGPHGASGLQALSDARRAVGSGEAPFAVAGGTDSPINVFMVSYFGVEGLLSPSGRCRPFATDADGTVPGEAAAMLWIEDAHRAADRGATALARILGYGEAHHDGAYGPPVDSTVYREAGERALADAGLRAEDLRRWVADGWGVPPSDRAEEEAAHGLFHGRIPPRRAGKARYGHCFAAAGAVEVALSVCQPADGPELIWGAGVDGSVAAVVLEPLSRGAVA